MQHHKNGSFITQKSDIKFHDHIYFEKKEIGGFLVEVTTSSHYTIPWNTPSSEKPKDYYERQSKIITYYKNNIDQNNNPIRTKVDIEIPTIEVGLNRKRLIAVKIDGIPIDLHDNKILDMKNTFDIRDVNLLMQIAYNNAHLNTHPAALQAIGPFIYLSGIKGDPNYTFNTDNSGDINSILYPYVEAMCHLKNQFIARKLLIPVATHGEPHHWNLCVLSINKDNIPSLTYVESINLLRHVNHGFDIYSSYMADYKYDILPCINSLLTRFQYPKIDVIEYCQAKQFSYEGCGIAMSLNIQKILAGCYPEIICHSNANREDLPPLSEIDKLSSNVSIEEDAIIRAELALKIHLRESIVRERDLDEESVKVKSLSCSKILNHPHSLKTQAKEAFTFFQPAPAQDDHSLINKPVYNVDSSESPVLKNKYRAAHN